MQNQYTITDEILKRAKEIGHGLEPMATGGGCDYIVKILPPLTPDTEARYLVMTTETGDCSPETLESKAQVNLYIGDPWEKPSAVWLFVTAEAALNWMQHATEVPGCPGDLELEVCRELTKLGIGSFYDFPGVITVHPDWSEERWTFGREGLRWSGSLTNARGRCYAESDLGNSNVPSTVAQWIKLRIESWQKAAIIHQKPATTVRNVAPDLAECFDVIMGQGWKPDISSFRKVDPRGSEYGSYVVKVRDSDNIVVQHTGEDGLQPWEMVFRSVEAFRGWSMACC